MATIGKSSAWLLATAVALALLLGGCGEGGDSSETPTKAQLIAKGNAICNKADKRQSIAYEVYVQENGEDKSKSDEEKLVTEIGLPAIRIEIEELRALGAPSGDEDELEAMLDEVEEAAEKTEKKPSSVLAGGTNPFTAVEKQAKAYGLKDCGFT